MDEVLKDNWFRQQIDEQDLRFHRFLMTVLDDNYMEPKERYRWALGEFKLCKLHGKKLPKLWLKYPPSLLRVYCKNDEHCDRAEFNCFLQEIKVP